MSKLTKKLVDSLGPKNKDYIVWDDKISGFGIKVTPQGRKVYLLKYRSEDGRQRKPTIGVHGNITCEEAREIAENWQAEKAKGNDPAEARFRLRESPTVSDLCDRFLKEHVEVHKKPGTVSLDKFYIRKYIKPKIGALKTVSVTKGDIQKLHLSMKKTPAQANRILNTLSKMFSLAEDWSFRPANSNPVKGIQRYKESSRERYLTQQELACLGEVLNESEKQGTETPHFIALVRLLILTGARLREVMHAKWEWIDKEAGLLILPDSKTGKKIIHLSPAALEVLEAIPKIKSNPYIIVGEKEGKPLISPKKPWRRVKEVASMKMFENDNQYKPVIQALRKKLKRFPNYSEFCAESENQGMDKPEGITDVRLHDLRHTYASICVGHGMPIQMVAKLLGHAQIRTSERYAHLARDPVSNAAASVGNIILNSLKKANSNAG